MVSNIQKAFPTWGPGKVLRLQKRILDVSTGELNQLIWPPENTNDQANLPPKNDPDGQTLLKVSMTYKILLPGCRDRAGVWGRGALLEDPADAQGPINFPAGTRF